MWQDSYTPIWNSNLTYSYWYHIFINKIPSCFVSRGINPHAAPSATKNIPPNHLLCFPNEYLSQLRCQRLLSAEKKKKKALFRFYWCSSRYSCSCTTQGHAEFRCQTSLKSALGTLGWCCPLTPAPCTPWTSARLFSFLLPHLQRFCADSANQYWFKSNDPKVTCLCLSLQRSQLWAQPALDGFGAFLGLDSQQEFENRSFLHYPGE